MIDNECIIVLACCWSSLGKSYPMYLFTQHCRDQMQQRRIDERLIGWCLAKGTVRAGRNAAQRFKLDRPKLEEALRNGAADGSDLCAVFELVVVVQSKKLVTVIVRKGDTGMVTSNQHSR